MSVLDPLTLHVLINEIFSGYSALFAVRQAVAAAKQQWGENNWCAMSAPATIDKVALAANVPVSVLGFT